MSNQQPTTKNIKMFSSEILVNAVPPEIWREEIFTNLGYVDRSNGNATCNEINDTFENYNQKFLKKHAIHVPQDTPTIEKAMELVAKLQLVPTEKDPLRIVLDKGIHEIVGNNAGSMNVTYSHITFVGKGKDHTTIRGGFKVENQQNVKFEELTVTNHQHQYGHGLQLQGSETNVDVLKCAVKECGGDGMWVGEGATVTATLCEFMENVGAGVFCVEAKARLNDCQMHHNVRYGLVASEHGVVDLHGTKTDIHSNKVCGIWARLVAKVNIHVPSQHNTPHDNGEDRCQFGRARVFAYNTSHDNGEDRCQVDGGSIATINADGTIIPRITHLSL